MCLNALSDTGCHRRARLARCFRLDVDAHECAEPTMGHGESVSERTSNDNEGNNGDAAGGCDQCGPDHNDDHSDNTTCSCRQTNEADAKSDVCDVSACIHEGARGPRIGYLSVRFFVYTLFFSYSFPVGQRKWKMPQMPLQKRARRKMQMMICLSSSR